ncbi:MAG: hypothetical protein ABJQ29_06715 [Luteolibacter sp.]
MSAATSVSDNKLAMTYAALLLRLWLAVRAIQTGVEKFAGSEISDTAVEIDGQVNDYGLTAASSAKTYALENYQGVPPSLMGKFKDEPLLPDQLLSIFDKALGPALILLGLTILLGFFYRTSLFLLGLIYIGLTWGLILIKQDEGVSWLAVHMVLIVLALWTSANNRFGILKKW